MDTNYIYSNSHLLINHFLTGFCPNHFSLPLKIRVKAFDFGGVSSPYLDSYAFALSEKCKSLEC
jgi:hypothetical protein